MSQLPSVHPTPGWVPREWRITFLTTTLFQAQQKPVLTEYGTDLVSAQDARTHLENYLGESKFLRSVDWELPGSWHVSFATLPCHLAQDLRHQSTEGTRECLSQTGKLPGVQGAHPGHRQLPQLNSWHLSVDSGSENGPGGAAAPAGVSTALTSRALKC